MSMRQYIQDYKRIVRLGLPIIAGQAGMIVVGFADNIMLGNYSTEALASASFVNNVFNLAILTCIGFTYGLTPLVGALFGRGKLNEIGRMLRGGMLLNILYCALVCLCMMAFEGNLDRIGQPEELMPLVKPYYLLALAGILPIVIFNVLAQCSYGMRQTRVPMWIILAANVINISGNWLLIYGNLGCPQLGIVGAGISTLLSRLFCATAIAAYFLRSRFMTSVRQGLSVPAKERGLKRRIFATSFPVSMQLMFESAAFSGAAIIAGWLGKIELASFQVMVTIGQLGFCFYYSLGSATSVLVANYAGQKDSKAMRRVGFAGYHLTLLLALFASLTFVFAGKQLIGLFSDDPAVISMSMSLILPMVAYQLGDATQTNFANALRGTSKVMPVLWIALISYVIVGLPVTYLLRHSIVTIFYSFSASLFLAAALFIYFFLKNTRE